VIGVSFSLVFIVLADSLWLLVVGVMFLSAFSNTTQGAWQALVPDQVPQSQRGTAAGIKTILELVGIVAGVAVVGTALARGYLWGAPLVAMALFGIILVVTLFTLAQTTKPPAHLQRESSCQPGGSTATEPDQASDRLNSWPGLSFLRQMPASFLWWMLNRALFWSAIISIRTFMLNYMEDVLVMTPAEAQVLSSRLFMVLGLGVFICALPAGAVADRIGRRPLLVMAGLMAALGAVSLVFVRELPLLFVAGGLIAIGTGIFASASWALATDLVPANQGAHYLGLANVATILGSISGRLGGLLIDGINHLTGTITAGYLVDFGLATLMFVASSLVVYKIVNR
jgi:MFS family permease